MQETFVQTGRASRRVTQLRQQCGFSILEMLLASVIMMVGVISVVQLVPASLQLNANNRLDTLATVIAQRELDQMVTQPLSVDTFLDTDGRVISLGGPNSPGATLAIDPQTLAPQIDFSANPVTGFSIPAYVDKNDPNGATFDVRWAVISLPKASPNPISRRIIIGCRKTNATGSLQLPVTLDTWVHR
jgi:type II secretory pathway pseudopilin PulG